MISGIPYMTLGIDITYRVQFTANNLISVGQERKRDVRCSL